MNIRGTNAYFTEDITVAGTTNISENLNVTGSTVIDGSLNVIGGINFMNEIIQTDVLIRVTEQLDISNNGTGPALIVKQVGTGSAHDVAQFYNNESDIAMSINEYGYMGIGKVDGSTELDVSGTITVDDMIADTISAETMISIVSSSNIIKELVEPRSTSNSS